MAGFYIVRLPGIVRVNFRDTYPRYIGPPTVMCIVHPSCTATRQAVTHPPALFTAGLNGAMVAEQSRGANKDRHFLNKTGDRKKKNAWPAHDLHTRNTAAVTKAKPPYPRLAPQESGLYRLSEGSYHLYRDKLYLERTKTNKKRVIPRRGAAEKVLRSFLS